MVVANAVIARAAIKNERIGFLLCLLAAYQSNSAQRPATNSLLWLGYLHRDRYTL
jgi:hypothetical protein